MPWFNPVGYSPAWPLKIGASDPVGIVLTVGLVVFVNVVVYLAKKVWQAL
ncbi:hypothetical protein [Halolamina sediminis]|nr:hypothetical protein [Halolamina sediminis]